LVGLARRVKGEAKGDQVPLLAAGVAFFGLLALIRPSWRCSRCTDWWPTRGHPQQVDDALALHTG
jgi:hypothetical protein